MRSHGGDGHLQLRRRRARKPLVRSIRCALFSTWNDSIGRFECLAIHRANKQHRAICIPSRNRDRLLGSSLRPALLVIHA